MRHTRHLIIMCGMHAYGCVNENHVSTNEFNIKMTRINVPFQLIIPAYMLTNFALIFLQAFEHLVQRELIGFMDNRGNNQPIEFRAVKLLISSHELFQGLKSYRFCPVSSFKDKHLCCVPSVLSMKKYCSISCASIS